MQMPETDHFDLRVTPQEAQTIVEALVNLPYRLSAGLIQSLTNQMQTQLQLVTTVEPDPATDTKDTKK
jgi:hypothetical protein